ncbi:MAG: hypothetical protein Q8M29_00450 [Bacteroidota bacterium]|nr:hypothetical protein [Bacteroidota bacterium]
MSAITMNYDYNQDFPKVKAKPYMENKKMKFILSLFQGINSCILNIIKIMHD